MVTQGWPYYPHPHPLLGGARNAPLTQGPGSLFPGERRAPNPKAGFREEVAAEPELSWMHFIRELDALLGKKGSISTKIWQLYFGKPL